MKNFIRYLIVIGLLIATTAIGEAKITPTIPFSHSIYVQKDCPNGGLTNVTLHVASFKIGKTPNTDGHYMREIKHASIKFSDNITY